MALSSSADDRPAQYWLQQAKSVECPRRISAIRVAVGMTGEARLGDLTQLEPGTLLQICGEGYNERTVKVRRNVELFYVFREDLDLPQSPETN